MNQPDVSYGAGENGAVDAGVAALRAYEAHLVTNFNVASKVPVRPDLEIASRAFKEAAKRFPGMSRPLLPKDYEPNKSYGLVEPDQSADQRDIRALSLRPTLVAVAASHPLGYGEQDTTVVELARVVDSLAIINPLFIDYADFKFAFELDFRGNHHLQVLKALFGQSAFHKLVERTGAVPTNFGPAIFAAPGKTRSVSYYFELRPRTSQQEIDSGKYDGDHIAAICSVVKRADFKSGQSLEDVLVELRVIAIERLCRAFIEEVVAPLRRSLAGQ